MKYQETVSKIIDLIYGKSVPTAKKILLANKMAVHLMQDYTPAKFSALSNEHKAELVIEGFKKMLKNVVIAGGQKESQVDAMALVEAAGKSAIKQFDPDLD